MVIYSSVIIVILSIGLSSCNNNDHPEQEYCELKIHFTNRSDFPRNDSAFLVIDSTDKITFSTLPKRTSFDRKLLRGQHNLKLKIAGRNTCYLYNLQVDTASCNLFIDFTDIQTEEEYKEQLINYTVKQKIPDSSSVSPQAYAAFKQKIIAEADSFVRNVKHEYNSIRVNFLIQKKELLE